MKFLADTDILVDYLRNQPQAVAFITEHCDNISVSVLSVAELYAGMRAQEEMILSDFLSLFTVLPLSAEIAITGGHYKNLHHRKHGTGLADALIAATAQAHGATLVTLNKKHYPDMQHLLVPYRKH